MLGINPNQDEVQMEVVLGGLRPYNTQSMSDLKDFLTHHWEDVAAASGQEFKYEILNSTDITYDTEPPCRATVVVRQINPEAALKFFKEVQHAFYFENKNLHSVDSYRGILEKLDIDYATFVKHFESREMKEAIKADFEYARSLGVNSFPTLLLQKDGEVKIVAAGYAKAKSIIEKIDSILGK